MVRVCGVERVTEPYLVTSSLRCVVGQRLARRLCEHCKTTGPAHEGEVAVLRIPGDGPITEVPRPVGCKACGNTGYRGRLAIYEILVLDDEIRSLIARAASGPEVKRDG